MLRLHELLTPYDACNLECDGLTRVLHTVLRCDDIEHSCFVGSLTDTRQEKHIPLHFWIELPDGRTVDYRARMWIREADDIPHGIFNKADYPHIQYSGQKTTLEPLSPILFEALTMKNPFEGFLKNQPNE